MDLLIALLETFLELEFLSQLMVIVALVAMYFTLQSYLSPPAKRKDKTKKYNVEIKGMKGEVHVKDK